MIKHDHMMLIKIMIFQEILIEVLLTPAPQLNQSLLKNIEKCHHDYVWYLKRGLKL